MASMLDKLFSRLKESSEMRKLLVLIAAAFLAWSVFKWVRQNADKVLEEAGL